MPRVRVRGLASDAMLGHLSPTVQFIVVFIAWITLNISLNYYNKFLLSKTGFKFPLFLTLCNKTAGLVVAMVVMSCSKSLPNITELGAQFRRPIVHLQGIATALSIGLNNWSLLLITLSLNQVIKSTVPLPTALLSVLVEGKSFGWQLWASMLVLVLGCCLAVYGAFGTEPLIGVVVCVGSLLATASWTVLSAYLLQQGEKPLDAITILFVSGPTCVATMLVFFCSIELKQLAEWSQSDDQDTLGSLPPGQVIAFGILISASMGVMYDIVHNQFVKLTSSLTVVMVADLKLVLVILLSMFTLETPPSAMRVVGIVLAVGAASWYSFYKVLESTAKEAEKAKLTSGTSISSSIEKDPEKNEPLVAGKPTEATGLLVKK